MSPTLHHECIRVPVTALAAAGTLLLAAEGPSLRFYCREEPDHVRFLASKRIFKEHAIHGISTRVDGSSRVVLAVWGGPLVRFLRLGDVLQNTRIETAAVEAVHMSSVIRSPDWILDLAFGPANPGDAPDATVAVCAAVTAHNALVQLTVQLPDMAVHLSELTSSSRSILYSAHLLWDGPGHVLVAAGTAFGEIMFWSWRQGGRTASSSNVHKVFLGHEGSIFGVQISREIDTGSGSQRRFLASCSDDRTIRVWDISGLAARAEATISQPGTERTRHTGFSNVELESDSPDSPCLAVGWGHLSRVWKVQFLEAAIPGRTISLLSAGEDATCRTWKFTLPEESPTGAPLKLQQIGTAAYHSGKNLWSTALLGSSHAGFQVVTGGADSKISAHALTSVLPDDGLDDGVRGYTVEDIIALNPQCAEKCTAVKPPANTKASRATEFFRSYAFIDSSSFLLSTNSGKIFLETIALTANGSGIDSISKSELIDQVDEVSGYSICAAESEIGVGFVAGFRGGVYMYQKGYSSLSKIYTAPGKVGGMFIARPSSGVYAESIALLVTLMGRQQAQLIYIDCPQGEEPVVSRTVDVPLPESGTAATVTSMAYTSTRGAGDHIFIGFRVGSIAAYSLHQGAAALIGLYEKIHGKEAVTSLLWYPTPSDPLTGHLVSAGRDGCCIIHHVDFSTNSLSLLHHLPLPVGPNIEGMYDHHGHLMIYGFSSTKFVVYDMFHEEETVSVETGGSHRSWAFHPSVSTKGGGTLVWNRASSMHIHYQPGCNHEVIRSGGHGREIKTLAISPGIGGDSSRKLIATGAEDTDIKIFEYVNGDFECRRTLRKHITGIQQLQWSEDGEYLFSSGGCEEFYVWHVRSMPSFIGIGVFCESICAPESEHSDLRLTAFDVRRQREGFIIAMVFSDSTMRVYNYAPASPTPVWHTLAIGTYFTSCLTQCIFLSPSMILTAGTDGHAVLWPFTGLPSTGNATSPQTLTWEAPSRIHQNSSKSFSTQFLSPLTRLIVSGGDDGSLSLFLCNYSSSSPPTNEAEYGGELVRKAPPTTLLRAHTSAITACAIVPITTPEGAKTYVLTSGNDQWIRLWEVDVTRSNEKEVAIKRISKMKTNVADVSSMTVLDTGNGEAVTRVVVCGVGMEMLCLRW